MALSIYGIDMSKKDDPHDDCTHWAGNIPETNTDIPKCTDQRTDRGKPKPNPISKELGLEKTR